MSFSVREGERVAVVGANGAGKSTLLLALVGILNRSGGSVSIGGVPVERARLPEIREKAGLVFQNPDDQLFMPRVCDDVAFGPRNYGATEEEAGRAAESVLRELGIEHLKDRMSHRLSGGEKRMVAIASVLSMHPSVLLLDEPTSFLDPRARRGMIRELARLPHTQLIATHDLDMALELCGRVLILKEGRLCADGPAKKLLSDQKLLTDCGLELPLCLTKPEFFP